MLMVALIIDRWLGRVRIASYRRDFRLCYPHYHVRALNRLVSWRLFIG
jgi:hypothetical protein